MDRPDYAIRLESLGKRFRLYSRPSDILKEWLFRAPRHTERWALKGVNLEVKPGEVVGVVGRNGAGKSTLLKIICGLLDHTEGSVSVQGSAKAVLELGTGFHEEYSGRENIYLGGVAAGSSRKEMARHEQWIIDFSGLAEAMDHPLRTYSTGMRARLAFSVAFCTRPDILIVDEALSVGDQVFVNKCTALLTSLCRAGGTALIVSHNMFFLEQVCGRVLYLEKGRVKADGPPLEVCKQFERDMARAFAAEHVSFSVSRENTGDVAAASRITVPLPGPYLHIGGHCWTTDLPGGLEPSASTFVVLENESILSGDTSCVPEIRQFGSGRCALLNGAVFFSSSDGSDPNSNGREYSVRPALRKASPREAALASLPRAIRHAILSGETIPSERDFGDSIPLRALGLAHLADIALLDSKGKNIDVFETGSPVTIQATIFSLVTWKNMIAGYQIWDQAGNLVVSTNSKWHLGQGGPETLAFHLSSGITRFNAHFPSLMLGAGQYYLSFGLAEEKYLCDEYKHIYEKRCLSMGVVRSDLSQNVFYEPPVKWSLE